MESTPRSLLEKIRTQPDDQLAWERLLNIYRPWILGWLVRQSMSHQDAEDILQDVMVYLHKQLPHFCHNGNTGAFRSWLRRVIFNRIAQTRREKHNVSWPEGKDNQQEDFADDTNYLAQMWDLEHDRFVLQELLSYVAGDFEPKSWEVFRRYVFDRQSANTIASELQLTVGNVFAIKSRVVRRLRQVAQEVYPDLDY